MNQKNTNPFITVIIPAKNEAHCLPKVIDALITEKKTYGLIADIIIVDNYSTDNTFEIASKLNCSVIQAEGHVSKVRNAGAFLAKSQYLAFIDADVVISEGWSQQIQLTVFDEAGVIKTDSITGSICDIPSDANWLETSWFGSLSRRSEHSYINSGNLIIDRNLFIRCGGFNTDLKSGEDVDLCKRAKNMGGSIIYNPLIHAVHLGYPRTLYQFTKREFWHGKEMLRDIKHPLGNKALLLALLHLGYILLLLASLPVFHPASTTLLLAYPVVPLLLAWTRLESFDIVRLFQLGFLIALYSFTRATSLVASIFSPGNR
jgi:glycosyltransferase involved in cell wall biosynthesis